MSSDQVPPFSLADILRDHEAVDVASQRVNWSSDRWRATWAKRALPGAEVFDKLEDEWATNDGIRRAFVMTLTNTLELFIASMVWGFGEGPYGTARAAAMVEGLNTSFGTKFIYFAGYPTAPAPKPCIYDERVAWSLRRLAPELSAPMPLGMTIDAYERYTEFLAEQADAHGLQPDSVEFALFNAATWLRRDEWKRQRRLL
jgi:hypothetical protein